MRSRIRSAARRARLRGVDLMETNPRPLRNRKRLAAMHPNVTVVNAWEESFDALGKNLPR